METIFDIFGSCESVKPPTLNPLPQTFAAIKNVPSEGVLPGKQTIQNEGPTLKGKKVLGDVGNRIKGLPSKIVSNSKDSITKSQQGSCYAAGVSCPSNNQVTETYKKNIVQERQLTSQFIWEDDADSSNIDNWPEAETQGPSFWPDDNEDSVWQEVVSPTIQEFCNSANIWDIEMKCGGEHSPSTVYQEFGDDFQFCLDLPADHAPDMVLDEPVVEFPWEM